MNRGIDSILSEKNMLEIVAGSHLIFLVKLVQKIGNYMLVQD